MGNGLYNEANGAGFKIERGVYFEGVVIHALDGRGGDKVMMVPDEILPAFIAELRAAGPKPARKK